MKTAFLGVRVPGHLNPMTTLARKLKASGHDVVFMIDHPRELTELLLEYAPTSDPEWLRSSPNASIEVELSNGSSHAVAGG